LPDFRRHRLPKVWLFLDDTSKLLSYVPSLGTVGLSFTFLACYCSTCGAVHLQYSAGAAHPAQHEVREVVAQSKESCEEAACSAKQIARAHTPLLVDASNLNDRAGKRARRADDENVIKERRGAESIRIDIEMRVALVGLSSPCGYLYDRSRFEQVQPWTWNPILESPVGTAALFDEIWFLHRALCPLSMRSFHFVRFLNEESGFAELIDKELVRLHKYEDPGIQERMQQIIPMERKHAVRFGQIIDAATGMKPGPTAPIDNHSHPMKFGRHTATGDTWASGNIAFDLIMSQRLSEDSGKRIELITNSFTNGCIVPRRGDLAQSAASQALIVRRIPFLQTREGPVLEGIERLRTNEYLSDFRKKISRATSGAEAQDADVLVGRVEDEFSDYRNEVLLNHQGNAGLLQSTAWNLISFVARRVLPPGVLEAADLWEASQTRRMNWTAFLASLE